MMDKLYTTIGQLVVLCGVGIGLFTVGWCAIIEVIKCSMRYFKTKSKNQGDLNV